MELRNSSIRGFFASRIRRIDSRGRAKSVGWLEIAARGGFAVILKCVTIVKRETETSTHLFVPN